MEDALHKSKTSRQIGAWYQGVVPLDFVLSRMIADLPVIVAGDTGTYTEIKIYRRKDPDGEDFTSWKVTYESDV